MSYVGGLSAQQLEEPLPGDCCGNGCNPCVLDVYQDLLKKWKASSKTERSNTVQVLSMTRYMPFQLKSVRKLTSDTNVYKFQAVVAGFSDDSFKACGGRIQCQPGQHLMLKGKLSSEGDTVVTRAYTPISKLEDHETGEFEVMIKLYEQGTMSSFVNSLSIGDVTQWRGPYGSFKYKRGTYPSILMLCAGTGLAPMYSVANMIVHDELDDAVVRMLFSCKRVEDILLRNEIRALSSFWNFCADIFVSNDTSGSVLYGETLKFVRISKDDVRCEVDKLGNSKCLVLICGPPTFTDCMADIVKTCDVPMEHTFIF